jgi:hypothetical protein
MMPGPVNNLQLVVTGSKALPRIDEIASKHNDHILFTNGMRVHSCWLIEVLLRESTIY